MSSLRIVEYLANLCLVVMANLLKNNVPLTGPAQFARSGAVDGAKFSLMILFLVTVYQVLFLYAQQEIFLIEIDMEHLFYLLEV